ncbi:MAG: nucleotide exchange factor GrpE [Cyanobacteria bacterium RU_5_0]|nr:nucleotide exchange factor GrpE [Cyanobacteria bacterium RU_5_0]
MDEEKQLEHSQRAEAGISQTSEQVESEPMSAETNLPTDPEGNPIEVVEVQGTGAGESSEEFVLDSGIEPFTLDPEPSTPTAEQSHPSEEVETLKASVRELSQSLETLKAQLDDRASQYMRLAADFENYRKRTQKEKEDQEQQVKCSTVKELLPVVDNFERARSQIQPQTDSEMTIHKSYQGVYRDLVERLKKIGVAPMRTEGEPFDPNLHEAVMREMTDAYPEGSVVEELRRGYVLGDQVLRHAMVKVAAAPEYDESTSEEGVQLD